MKINILRLISRQLLEALRIRGCIFSLNFQQILGSDLFCNCSIKAENLFIKSFLTNINEEVLSPEITFNPDYHLHSPRPDQSWKSTVAFLQSRNAFAWVPSPTSIGKGTLIYPTQSRSGKVRLQTSWIEHTTLHDKTSSACCTGLWTILYKIKDIAGEAAVWTGDPRYAECALVLNVYCTPSGLTVLCFM